MLDLTKEQAIGLFEGARFLPPRRSGRPIHASTLFRWITKGVRGVRLEGVRIGNRWVTSREALQRFAEQLTPRLGDEEPVAPRGPAARQRAAERTERALAKIGI